MVCWRSWEEDKRWAKHQWHCKWDGHSSYAWAYLTLVHRFLSIRAEKSRDHQQWMEKMRHHRRPSKWCSFRWPIRTNLMNWIAVHLTFFVLCTFFCLPNRLPHYVWLQFITPQWQKSIKSRVFNLTEGVGDWGQYLWLRDYADLSWWQKTHAMDQISSISDFVK